MTIVIRDCNTVWLAYRGVCVHGASWPSVLTHYRLLSSFLSSGVSYVQALISLVLLFFFYMSSRFKEGRFRIVDLSICINDHFALSVCKNILHLLRSPTFEPQLGQLSNLKTIFLSRGYQQLPQNGHFSSSQSWVLALLPCSSLINLQMIFYQAICLLKSSSLGPFLRWNAWALAFDKAASVRCWLCWFHWSCSRA